MKIDRRAFSRTLALAAAGAALPAYAQQKLNIRIGHTGITWPWGNPPGGGPMRLADPPAIDQIAKDMSSLGFYGLELFGWQIDGMEAHGGIGPLLEKYKLPLISSYGGPNLTDPAQRKPSLERTVATAKLVKSTAARSSSLDRTVSARQVQLCRAQGRHHRGAERGRESGVRPRPDAGAAPAHGHLHRDA